MKYFITDYGHGVLIDKSAMTLCDNDKIQIDGCSDTCICIIRHKKGVLYKYVKNGELTLPFDEIKRAYLNAKLPCSVSLTLTVSDDRAKEHPLTTLCPLLLILTEGEAYLMADDGELYKEYVLLSVKLSELYKTVNTLSEKVQAAGERIEGILEGYDV